MIAGGSVWRTQRSRLLRLVTLAGVAVAVVVLVLDLGFFFRPGTPEVLGGLAHHAFVLGLMLVLTSGSRTVSLSTLGVFWLIGVWTIAVVGYLLESQLTGLFGVDSDSLFQLAWSGPIIEEATRLAPVVIFLLLAGGSGYRHPSMSDGMLLGFAVGAGVSFMEDAHIGEILLSGDGWGAAKPWSMILPTISPLDSHYIALNNALWAALSGLTIGVAVMLRHWRWAWPIALIGPLLSFANHLMSNHYTTTEFGIEAILGRGSDVPWIYEMIRDLTVGGRLQMVAPHRRRRRRRGRRVEDLALGGEARPDVPAAVERSQFRPDCARHLQSGRFTAAGGGSLPPSAPQRLLCGLALEGHR